MAGLKPLDVDLCEGCTVAHGEDHVKGVGDFCRPPGEGFTAFPGYPGGTTWTVKEVAVVGPGLDMSAFQAVTKCLMLLAIGKFCRLLRSPLCRKLFGELVAPNFKRIETRKGDL